ncbi:MAG TPA: DUF2071 domain-containing protein [Chloroflexia bacterium]|nr:DUF2071 domain-containing protein [Chloroflexia bacterium]
MKLPTLQGVIDRRILVNYRVDPEILEKLLPAPFHPKLVKGLGVAGICLIRLTQLRPQGLPALVGLTSESAAHRIAVQWEEGGLSHEGVYIPRRDTASRFNTWVGGRLFPGVHHHAQFQVTEHADQLAVAVDSDDGETHVAVAGQVAASLPPTSIFGSLAAASAFFAGGSVGYSPTRHAGELQGLELEAFNWHVEPFRVSAVQSSFFDDTDRFPPGTCTFDCALLMRKIAHLWHEQAAVGAHPAA